jgi:hypothetical protein
MIAAHAFVQMLRCRPAMAISLVAAAQVLREGVLAMITTAFDSCGGSRPPGKNSRQMRPP